MSQPFSIKEMLNGFWTCDNGQDNSLAACSGQKTPDSRLDKMIGLEPRATKEEHSPKRYCSGYKPGHDDVNTEAQQLRNEV
jgi:hypothetical protein